MKRGSPDDDLAIFRHMDDRRLRYFLAVVDEGSVTRAAARLRVAQPSLSQALRAFEEELGAQLFHRVGRGLRLSAAGEAPRTCRCPVLN